METVLFYGVPQGCSFGAIVTLAWQDRPFHLCRIDMLDRPWHPLYGKVNPLFLTPALLDKGQRISESLAILQHLGSLDPEFRLYAPQGNPEFSRHNQMLSYLHTAFFSAFTPLWILMEAGNLDESNQSLLRRMGLQNVKKVCAYLERCLDNREWLVGSGRSVADAYLAGVSRWIQFHELFDVTAEYPRLGAYLERLHADPGVRFAKSIEEDENTPSQGNFLGHVTLQELEATLV